MESYPLVKSPTLGGTGLMRSEAYPVLRVSFRKECIVTKTKFYMKVNINLQRQNISQYAHHRKLISIIKSRNITHLC